MAETANTFDYTYVLKAANRSDSNSIFKGTYTFDAEHAPRVSVTLEQDGVVAREATVITHGGDTSVVAIANWIVIVAALLAAAGAAFGAWFAARQLKLTQERTYLAARAELDAKADQNRGVI